MEHILRQNVAFFDPLGQRYEISTAEYISLLRGSGTQVYLLCAYGLLVATDAPGMLGKISLTVTLGLWALVVVLFLVTHGLVIFALAALQQRTKRFTTPGFIAALAALTPTVLIGEWLTAVASHGAVPFAIWPRILFYFVIAEMFILIYMRYVRPVVSQPQPPAQAEPEPEPAAASTATPEDESDEDSRRILIGAEPVPLARLRHIQAREHHVHVVLDRTTITQRARLSDIVAQTEPDDGIQPHRSWWVAARVARGLSRDGQKHVLKLDDGTSVPVARSRLTEVREWLDRRA